MATDEVIIKKRLLIEGDGGGDDKRISTLLKVRTLCKCHSFTRYLQRIFFARGLSCRQNVIAVDRTSSRKRPADPDNEMFFLIAVVYEVVFFERVQGRERAIL